MQITTLNKVINLMLVGLFVLLLLVLFKYNEITSYLSSGSFNNLTNTISGPVIVFILALLLFSTTMFLGLIVDALTNLLRAVLKPFYENKVATSIIRCRRGLDSMLSLRDKFNEMFSLDNRYKEIAKTGRSKTLAVAIMFRTASPEHLDWTLQHYAMYVLSTNYLTLLLIGFVVALLSDYSVRFKIIFCGADILAIYLLLHSAVDRYLYVYENTYRHALMVLSEKEDLAKAAGT